MIVLSCLDIHSTNITHDCNDCSGWLYFIAFYYIVESINKTKANDMIRAKKKLPNTGIDRADMREAVKTGLSMS